MPSRRAGPTALRIAAITTIALALGSCSDAAPASAGFVGSDVSPVFDSGAAGADTATDTGDTAAPDGVAAADGGAPVSDAWAAVDAVVDDAVVNDAAPADVATADAAKPDAAKPDTASADTADADIALPDAGVADVGPADAGPHVPSDDGCKPWFGGGCGGCACEQTVCGLEPACCSELWGQTCAKLCAANGGSCEVPDAGSTDTAADADADADAGTAADADADVGIPPGCNPTYTGSIPGATLDLSQTPCSYSISAANGSFPLPYDIVVSTSEQLYSTDENAGQCKPAFVHGGIATWVEIEGIAPAGIQKWCMCDTGLCAGQDVSYTATTVGTHTHDFVWDGQNWFGPSDFGNQPGPPFPPGNYTLRIKAQGLVLQAGGVEDAWVMQAELPMVLVP